MTTLKILIPAALIAIAASGPATAQQVPAGPAGAIAHFNQSLDAGERLIVPTERARVALPRRAQMIAIRNHNASADPSDRIVGPGTIFRD